MQGFPDLSSKIEQKHKDPLETVQAPAKATFAQHVGDIAVLFEPRAGTFMIASKTSGSYASRGHDLRIAHLTLGIVMMVHSLSQIVTQAIRRYNMLVHGLPPLRGVYDATPHESEKAHGCLVGRNLG